MLGLLLGARFRLQFALRSGWGVLSLGAGTSVGGGAQARFQRRSLRTAVLSARTDLGQRRAGFPSGFSRRLPARILGEVSPRAQAL